MFNSLSKRLIAKRFQSSTTRASTTKEAHPFQNKFNFNLNPPQVHEYWNIYNTSVLLAFIPVFLGTAFIAKDIGSQIQGYTGLLQYADGEKSPLKSIKFDDAKEISKE
ncbi:hypothetical protein PVL30_003317 [Lodderomyces elongisporus]|uniref:uncharacterized protein n=1 Tax=Lodderomyces elongisporus TaxID=36914 RepID=UPI002926F24F|nr:uncharacterized protein PVL30_003317 [Lodderomyces elongisporus]WLF79562.1 hypothetical protein PVL30_003317 [Lodderomyces elongisporus]